MKFLRTKHILAIYTMTTLVGCLGGVEGEGSSISPEYIEDAVKTISLTAPTNNLVINNSSASNFSTSGDCSAEGESLKIEVDSVEVSTVTCNSGNFSFSFDTSWLNEGVNSVALKYSSGESAAISVTKDTVDPTLTITSPGNINSLNDSNFTLSGTCSEDGAVSGTIGSVIVSGNCTGGTFSIGSLDVSGEAQGSISISLSVNDSAQNTSVAVTSTSTIDSISPVMSFNTLSNINLSNSGAYSFSGNCSENGENVSVDIGGVTTSTTCSAGSFTVSSLNVSGASESLTLSISATQLDTFGNSTTINSNLVKDTIIPTVTIDTPAMISQISESFYTVSGTCSEDGRPVSGLVDVIPYSTTCNSGTWIQSGINLSFLADGTYSVTAVTTDAVSNSSTTASDNAIKNTTIALPSINFTNPVSGYGNSNSVTIQIGSIANGHTVSAYSDNTCSTLIRSEVSTGTTHDMTFTNGAEGVYSYYFTITDLVPNTTSCLGPKVYNEDQTAPTSPLTVTMNSPGDGETSNDSTPIFAGTINASEEGATITVYRDVGCSDSIGQGTVSSGAFNVLTSLAVDGTHNGLNQFFLKVEDKASNVSACFSSGLSFTLSGGGLATLPKLAMVGNNSPSQLVSLEDANQITWTRRQDPGNPIDLGIVNAGQVIDIEDPSNSAIKVDYGDKIESTKACYVVTQGYGTAPWASEAYAGTKFTSYQYRYGGNSPKVYVAAISSTSFVQILQDTDGDTILDVVDYFNIPAGTVHEFTVNLVDGRPWQVVSTQNVNVYYLGSSNGSTYDKDARVLTPAANDVIGYSFYITSIENNTKIDAYRNDNNIHYDTTINVNESVNAGRTLKSSLDRWATRVIADKPVSMLQIADQDGINATPSLPVNMLATHYGIPRAADYIGIIAIVAGTTITVTAPDGSDKGTFSLARNASANALAPYSYKYTDGGSIAAGTRIACSNPCFMIYDDEGPGADEDETIMMGFTP
jgi:hypothetical protein